MSNVMFEIPFPPAILSPNARPNRYALAKAKRDYRERCGWAGIAARQRHGSALVPPVEAMVVFFVPDKRRRDEDNLRASLKAAWDGLVDSGLLEDDSADKFTVLRSTIAVRKGERMVWIHLSSREGLWGRA